MRKNQKGFSVVEGLLALVIVVVIGLVGWFVYQKQLATKDKSSQQASDKPSQQASKNQTITEIVTSIKERISQEVPAVKVVGAENRWGSRNVHYKVANYDYLSTVESKILVNYVLKNPVKPGSALEASLQQLNQPILSPVKDIILSVLHENGFKELTNYPLMELLGDGALYEREADVCTVHIGWGWYSMGINCVTKEEFAKVANEVKPFVEALGAAKVEEPGVPIYHMMETGTGTTENDKYAIVQTGFAHAYFYQENGKWVYFKSERHGISCTTTATNPIAAKAFSKICYQPSE